MATIKISDLSVGDWVALETADLKIEHGDIATAFVEEVRKPICVQSILGEDKLVFARAYHLDDYGTIYAKEEYLRPIPITPEILEANGIHKTYECDEYAVYKGEGFSITEYYTDLWSFESRRDRVTIRRVHQLQHALRLAGVEKEIVMP